MARRGQERVEQNAAECGDHAEQDDQVPKLLGRGESATEGGTLQVGDCVEHAARSDRDRSEPRKRRESTPLGSPPLHAT